jgi:hypothetical protein
MIAYKGFCSDFTCRSYQFVMGLNVTERANCAKNGFHCAENPLDCLTYYPQMEESIYCIVDAGGDIDEDNYDSKISCTELTIIKQLSREEFFLHALVYMVDHPKQKWNRYVKADRAESKNGYAIVRGIDPIARGEKLGDILAFAKENPNGDKIEQIALVKIDGKITMPGIWYDIKQITRKDMVE